MTVDSNVKQQVREFYDQIGWQEAGEGVYQNAHYEDLRPVSREYIHRCHLRIPATRWRVGNLERLQRSLRKRHGSRSLAQVDADFAALRAAYDAAWQRGY